MKKRPAPPWLYDSNPSRWVTLTLAAHFYFRKHPVTMKRAIKSGYLEENGIPSYFDGFRWWVRLPYDLIQPAKAKRIRA